MAQAHINISSRPGSDEIELTNKRKVSMNIDGCHHVSVFANEESQVVVNIRKGTRSVTITKEVMLQICDLKETLIKCCNFIDS